MNRAGFTTVEVLIASALIIALVAAGGVGFRQITLLNQFAANRTSHTEMRTKVLEALSDTGNCAQNIGKGLPGAPAFADATVPVPLELDFIGETLAVGGVKKVVEKDQMIDGLKYTLGLEFPSPASQREFKSGLGRPMTTIRHQGIVTVRAERVALKESGGAHGSVLARIPLSVEFDKATGMIATCTLNPEDMDEVLGAGSTHTVRDCYHADGVPIPTELGLICRIPNTNPVPTGYTGQIPSCASLTPPGPNPWKDVSSPINFNTTTYLDQPMQGCKGTKQVVTRWHSMSPQPVEFENVDIKKGQKDRGIIAWGGAGATAAAVALSATPVGWAIAIFAGVTALLTWIFVPSGCKTETVRFYARVNGVGCI